MLGSYVNWIYYALPAILFTYVEYKLERYLHGPVPVMDKEGTEQQVKELVQMGGLNFRDV